MYPYGLTEALLLISLCSGYGVLCLANKEQGRLRSIGYISGLLVMILSVFLFIGNLAIKTRACRNMPRMQHSQMMFREQAPPKLPLPELPRSK
ncbi:MAG: hypothetical protein WC510_04885 [Candidatus Omnitrophota bacterium]